MKKNKWILTINLSELSCGKCVNKISGLLAQKFTEKNPIEIARLDKKSLTLICPEFYSKEQLNALANELVSDITAMGFGAIALPFTISGEESSKSPVIENLTQNNHIELNFHLAGLSCQNCIKKITNLFSNVPYIEVREASRTTLKLIYETNNEGNNSLDFLIKNITSSIEKEGFSATYDNAVYSTSQANHVPPRPKLENQFLASELPANSLEKKSLSLMVKIEGMTCASCVSSVEKTLQKNSAIQEFYVNLAQSKVFISGPKIAIDEAIKSLCAMGYKSHIITEDAHPLDESESINKQQKKYLYQSIAGLLSAFLLMGYGIYDSMLLTDHNHFFWLISGIVSLLVIFFTGGHFYKNAWFKLKHLQTNMDTLIVLGVSTAWLYSFVLILYPNLIESSQRYLYFEASLMILGLINLGRYLETKAKNTSSKALSDLMSLIPDKAILVSQSTEQLIDINQILPGMILRLRIGDKVPVDGIIQDGYLVIDESLLTGEPIAVERVSHDKIFAGTIVQSGSALIKVSGVGKETALSQIIQTVEKAQSSKPPIARIADKIASFFVPCVLIIALLTALVWSLFGPEPTLNYVILTTISVLVIACPCALGLAVPMSIITSVGNSAKMGILIRDANVLERTTQIDTIIFDKTGTLTEGYPKVTQVITSFDGKKEVNKDLSELNWLHIAQLLETQTNHPLAQGIIETYSQKYSDYCKTHSAPKFRDYEISEFYTHVGLGIEGQLNGKVWYLGNSQLLESNSIRMPISDDVLSTLHEYQNRGASTVFLANENECVAIFIIEDDVKKNVGDLITKLKQKYTLWLVTGDNSKSAEAIANQVGIDNVIANATPDDKAKTIKKLQDEGLLVAMIGDGINDAPALAKADLSISMGKGSDIAKQTSDYILLNNELNKLPDLFKLAKKVQINIRQNLFFAFIYNIMLIPIAAGILYPVNGMLLNPMLSAMAMMLSSLTVVLNANRIR
ncbi:heavy metal translocating P-type ATPase [Thorsellia kenyensis]|uniref:Heavy metal translocating P-type ATPase n=1 Tax=Thorsellia kenyensis TaxID=1549888 RepID=A0ABV6C9B4_9GAMM